MYNFHWDGTFLKINIDEQVQIFSNVILNIMSNFIPNEIITINDKDPPWITSNIKIKIANKNSLFDKYIINGRNIFDLQKVERARDDIINAINLSKTSYYERMNSKLSDPNTTPKTY